MKIYKVKEYKSKKSNNISCNNCDYVSNGFFRKGYEHARMTGHKVYCIGIKISRYN